MTDPSVVLFGASGKTGRAVTAALLARGVPAGRLRLLTRRRPGAAPSTGGPAVGPAGPPAPGPAAAVAPGPDVRPVDLEDDADVARATEGAQVLHVLAPNLHPDEPGIVARAVRAARAGGVPRVVYHSVLRPGVRAMPHHWAKLEAEELLWASGLEVTVLQPSAYTQNLLACRRDGRFVVPYAVDVPFSLVDLADVAEVTARVLLEPGAHAGAVYELAGPVRTVADVAARLGLGAVRDRPPRAAPPTGAEPTGPEPTGAEPTGAGAGADAGDAGRTGYAARALDAMFDWYDAHGLAGNPRVLEWLLDRPPTPPEPLLRP